MEREGDKYLDVQIFRTYTFVHIKDIYAYLKIYTF